MKQLFTSLLLLVFACTNALAQTITVVSPNGGESYQAGDTVNISWTNTGSIPTVDIYYSTDNGTTTNTIAEFTTNNLSYEWVVPSVTSTECRIFVLNSNNNDVYDISDASFSIGIQAAGTVSLTYPNGGETFTGGQSANITWTSDNIDYVDLYYSTNGGTTWSMIADYVSAASGSYNWTIPNVSSSNVMVGITEYNNSLVYDIGDAAFTINQTSSLNVNFPDGGEVFESGTSTTIYWSNSGSTSYVNLYYSTDNGVNWTTIATGQNASNQYYNWTVPAVSSTNCLVKVSDYDDSNNYDVSNSTFEIKAGAKNITLITPNGGQFWSTNSSYYISYSVNNISTVNLYYSADNGTTYNEIALNQSVSNGSNSYYWYTPSNAGSEYKIKIEDASETSVKDVSASTFSLANPYLTITAPNGGQILTAGNYYNITWSGLNTGISYLKLYYSLDNGSTWTYINYATYANYSYSWLVPNSATNQALIKIEDYYNQNTSDISDAVFTINSAASSLYLYTPAGGEQWISQNSYYIYWTATNINYVDLYYTTDNGSNWTLIDDYVTASNGSYYWTTPNVASTECKIKVVENGGSLVSESPNSFSILNGYLSVSTPNGGEVYNGNQSVYAYIYNPGSYKYVNIDYSVDNGSTWISLYTSYYIGSGNYSVYWTVPNVSSTNCLMRVTDINNASNTDVSDNTFTINYTVPSFNIVSPTAGQIVVTNNYFYYIQFNSSASMNVKIEYSTDNMSTWSTIESSYSASTGNNYYSWYTPSTVSTECYIRVSDPNNSSYNDISSKFTLSDPYITVSTPNGGEAWQVGNSQYIYWTSSGGFSYVNIEYRTSPTDSWSTIVSGASNNGYYNWTVPNTPSSTCRLRISDYNNSSLIDQSNYNFSIVAAQSSSVTLTSHTSSGLTIMADATSYIYWNNTGVSNVKLEYNLNGNDPTAWTTIVASTLASDGYYAWSVPATSSNNCKIRISDAANSDVNDVSEYSFKIVSPYIAVNSPSDGMALNYGSSHTVLWNSDGVQYVNLHYSIDGGTNWVAITSGITNNGYYNWTVPYNPSTNCVLRVQDYYNPSTIYGVSSGTFTLNDQAASVTLSSLTGGQTISVGSSQTIYFSTTGGVDYIDLDYSTDNGATWIQVDSNYSATNGYYTWTTPNTPSALCKFRISQTGNSSVKDQSDYSFTITEPVLYIVYPNGGETLSQSTSYQVKYFMSGLTGNYVNFYYSLDSGATWTYYTYAYGTSGAVNNISWSTPNSASTNCLVKVCDYYNSNVCTQSESVFTIAETSPFITLTYPNGNESLSAGTSYNITWSSASTDSVKIEYGIASVSGGNIVYNWTTIASSTYNNGTYAWTAPNINSSSVVVRVTSTSNSSINDISNAFFSINTPSIEVIEPNGGEVWPNQNYKIVKWIASGISSYTQLYYSIDSAQTWTAISYGYNTNNSLSTYSWYVPNVESDKAFIKVTDYYTQSIYDTSNSKFTIQPAAPSLTLTSPNGGQVWNQGSSYYINWTMTSINSVSLYYSTDAGSSWTLIDDYETGTSYYWTTPSISSTTCLIKVVSNDNTSQFDISNYYFSITAPYYTVYSPNGGETYTGGNGTYIYWYALTSNNYARIEYSTDNGSSWTVITAATYFSYNNGSSLNSYYWTLPYGVTSSNCLVKVCDYYQTSLCDNSNSVFTINAPTPTVTVTTPNGGENWMQGAGKYIYWNQTNTNSVSLYYSTDGGSSYTLIDGYETGTSYYWTVPTVSSTTCLIKVVSNDNTSIYDVSDNYFTITEGYYSIYSPNGGETYTGGDGTYIYWYAVSSNNYAKIEYSTDNGSSWTTITTATYFSNNTGTSLNSYYWSVPTGVNSSNCLIRVCDYYLTSVCDNSNSVFTITEGAASVTVSTPNGGETWVQGSGYYIYWNKVSTSSVSLYYSTDGGSTYTLIDDNETGTSYYWSIPTVTSSTCLIKVVSNDDNSVYDVSNSYFTITDAYYSVYSPNGGESYTGGDGTYIYWYAVTPNNYAKIEYSADNGSTWNTITNATYFSNNTGTSLNSYNWTTPSDVTSSNCLIRVCDYYLTSVCDNSNAVFTITAPAPSVTVTYPNGGESWAQGSGQYIYWNKTNTSSVSLYYSTDGGTSYTLIDDYETGTSYYWTVPSVTSSTCLIKVVSNADNSVYDVSNSNFSITEPYYTVYSPNGGESYTGGDGTYIYWYAYTSSNYAKIEYSADNGSTWNTITSATYFSYNNGSYLNSYYWSTPSDVTSSNCLIRVCDYYLTSVCDNSNAVFTITAPAPSVTVTTPNGGENWAQGSGQYIYWNKTNVSSVSLYYSTDGGSSYTLIDDYQTGTSYYWTLPTVNSTTCLVKVVSNADNSVYDVSNSNFSIIEPYYTVYTPNGGESYTGGDGTYIYWYAYTSSNYAKIEYSTDNGSTWNTITGAAYFSNNTGSSLNSYYWSTPSDVTSSNCLIRICDYYLTSVCDNSNAVFTITAPAPSVTVTTPNGGESWAQGSSQYIYWNKTNTSSVSLYYSTDGGTTYTLIDDNQTGTSYYWTVPSVTSTTCLIKVVSNSDNSVYDVSNSNFSITSPYYTVYTPNGGETYTSGNGIYIYWYAYTSSNYAKIEYSTDNGSSWNTITNETYFSNNTGSALNYYYWSIPSSISSTQCLIRICDYNLSSVCDNSDATFTINTNAEITLVSPNGGEIWQTGSSRTIKWESVSVSNVKIEISKDGGSNWSTIVASTPSANSSNNTYSWSVSSGASNTCLVKVSSVDDGSVYDQSNSYFTIPNAVLALTSPNGNEVWPSGGTKAITWSSTSVANVKLEYSANGGTQWNLINANVTAANGYYNWSIPSSINSTNCRVKITNTANTAQNDQSNFAFTITQPSLTITSPNGGNTLTGLTYSTISWTSIASSGYVNLQYSTDNGTTWTTIANGVSNSGSYNWYVPNIATTNCKVKVIDYYTNTIFDESNAVFTINEASPKITVYTPNGGETFYTGTNRYIYWTSTSVAYVKIEYSTDNGSTWNTISNSTVAGNGYYYWNVPSTVSTACLVKISDKNNASINDISNSNFTIAQPVASLTVTYPNGGESFAVGSYHYITWSSALVDNVMVEFSSDGGSTWSTVVSNYSGNSYYAVVPNTVSSDCWIRVTDMASSLSDMSNAAFSIYEPTVNVNTITTDSVKTEICKGDSLLVKYTATGDYNTGNMFMVQLSDKTGSFTSAQVIGYKYATELQDSIMAFIPEGIENGDNYRIRVVSNDLPAIGSDNGDSLHINSPEFDFNADETLKYIPNASTKFTFIPATSDTVGFVYNWKFGTGDSSNQMNPTYNYTQPGFYTVGLTVTSLGGCSIYQEKFNYMDIEQIFPTIPNIADANNNDMNSTSMYTNFVGMSVGNNASVQLTTDGGVTWQTMADGNINGNLNAVYMYNDSIAFAAGANGNVYWTNNGGNYWQDIASSGGNALHSIDFIDSVGFVVGDNGTIIKLEVSHTGNVVPSNVSTSITSNCLGITASGGVKACVDNTGKVYIAQSGSWSVSPSYDAGIGLNSINFYNSNLGYVVGKNGTIVRYKNGSWSPVLNGLTSDFTSIQIKDTLEAYAVGSDGIVYVTKDGGESFERYSIGSSTANLRGMAYKSGKGVIVGTQGTAFRFGGNDIGFDLVDASTVFCEGESFDVNYYVSGDLDPSNMFLLEMSDVSGSFSSAQVIASTNSTVAGTFSATIPNATSAGTNYKIRLRTTNFIDTINGDFNVQVKTAPSVYLGNDTTVCAGNSVTLNAGTGATSYTWSTGETTSSITVNATKGVTVTIVGSNGCSAEDSVHVEVLNTLNVDLGSDLADCDSTTNIQLDAGVSGATYTWSTGATSQSISVTNSGTYNVSVNICSQTDKDTIVINLGPPNKSTVSITDTIITATSVSDVVSYQWYKGNDVATGTLLTGETNLTLTLTTGDVGYYFIAGKNGFGCENYSDAIYYTKVGLVEAAQNVAKVVIFPSPNNGNFNVAYSLNGNEQVKILVTNLLGAEVYNEVEKPSAGRTTKQLNLSDLADGVYLVQVESNTTKYTQRIVIRK